MAELSPRRPNPPASLPDARPAMSMVEIVICVAIIGVMTSVAGLAFRSAIEGSRVQQAADRFVADLRRARSCALQAQQPCTFQFDPANCSYSVTDLAEASNISSSLADSPYHLSAVAVQLNGAPPNAAVTFDAYGNADPAGLITLRCASRTVTISITAGGSIEQID